MTPEEIAAWRKGYQETAEALEAFRAQEIAGLTEERAAFVIRSLGAMEHWRERPDWSGLVEQQAIFHQKTTR